LPLLSLLSNFENYRYVDKALVECPNCKNKMRGNTLYFISQMSVPEFAQWVYNYRLNGFFDKIDFDQWNKQLKLNGIVTEFWDSYRKYKGENTDE
jgi:hypothetical protein